MKNITILGAGSWGSAIAIHLSKKNYNINLWMRSKEQKEKIQRTKENIKYLPGIVFSSSINLFNDIEKSIKDADVIVLAVPSQQVRNILMKLEDKATKDQVFVDLAKGLEKESNKRLSTVFKEILPNNKYIALSGPSHAEEVAKDLPTTLVCAGEDEITREYIQEIFTSPKLRVYTNEDLIGVELGGAFKNIIAFGVGIIDGLGYGDNTKAALMTRGIKEITRLGVKMGANVETFAGLSGIGDLIVTCTSKHSRNRKAGYLIGKGYSLEQTLEEVNMVVEGIVATNVAYNLSKIYDISMPITEEIYNVLYENKDVKESVIDLMMRPKKHETEDGLNL
ncbi:NAD(P)H-dependent glycerol-3-phosphate dehydrogenase [Peptostreptococcaceae bacterium AGR-M142]